MSFLTIFTNYYSWEFATSLDFDYQFLTGKKSFRWPLVSELLDSRYTVLIDDQIFYFAGRYVLLFALIGM